MTTLDGEIVLVTGASRGIGQAVARELGRRGAAVIGTATTQAGAEAIDRDLRDLDVRGRGLRLDVTDPAAVDAALKAVTQEFGAPTILVNNAGITRDKSIRKMTDQDWMDVIQTNLNAVFFCTTAAMQPMVEQKYGRIVNISSMNGQTCAFGQANYSASKGGVISFTRTAATELARYGITVNSVAPGYTDTDMFAAVPQAIQAQIKAKIPLGRFAHPHEIAKAVLFLVADGDYITGEQINVNGGAYDA